jgi:hypothetical protein
VVVAVILPLVVEAGLAVLAVLVVIYQAQLHLTLLLYIP